MMGKDSCINHSGGLPYIVIKQTYVNLFSGSHSLAATMYALEFFTNGEITRLDNIGSSDPPWVEVSISRLVIQMAEMYGSRTIQRNLMALRKLGLISVAETPSGKTNRYLIDIDRINSMLERKVRLEIPSDAGDSAPDLLPPNEGRHRVTSDRADDIADDIGAKNGPILNLKVEEVKNIRTSSSGYASKEGFNEILKQWKSFGVQKLDRSNYLKLTNACAELAKTHSIGEILTSMNAYLSDGPSINRGCRLTTWLRQFERWLAAASAPAERPARANGTLTSPKSANAYKAPEAVLQISALQKEQDMADWNADFPECPVNYMTDGVYSRAFDLPVKREKFKFIRTEARRLVDGAHPSWQPLDWLMDFEGIMVDWPDKPGKWLKIINRRYEYLLRPRGHSKKAEIEDLFANTMEGYK